MNNKSVKREFDRFPVEFVLEVASEDSEGNKFNERTVLKDISGEGARFITQQAGKYFPGQSLEMTIYLPGTDEMEAHMKAKAIVVRIDPLNDSEKANKSPEGCIAVKFETHLNFARISV